MFANFRRNPEVSALWDQGQIVEGLNAIDWSSDTIQDLENTVTSGLSLIVCASVSGRTYSLYNYYLSIMYLFTSHSNISMM